MCDVPAPADRLKRGLAGILSFKGLVGVGFSLVLIGIVANAAMLQKGRHPAPLFGAGQTTSDPVPALSSSAAAAKSAAALPSTNAAREAAPDAPASADPEAATTVRTVTPKKVSAKPQHDDGIARLLREQPLATDPTAGMVGGSRAKAETAPSEARRQLAEIGFAVRSDGHLGAAPRDGTGAVRGRHVAVDGDATAVRHRHETAAKAP